MTSPDWLTVRDGSLKPGLRPNILFVMLGGQPQYRLETRPASGSHACTVLETINGRRLDAGTTYPTPDDAIRGGLEQLRQVLGW